MGFFFANDEHIGYATELIVADFATQSLVSVVDLEADIGFFKLASHGVGVVEIFVAHRNYNYLFWREPERQSSGCVLEEYSHETFHRTERGAVNHHGAVLGIVRTGVFEFEALGQVVVHLDCAELPAAANGVADHEVELGTVECSFAQFGAGVDAFLGASLDDSCFGLMPVFVRTYIFFLVFGVAERNLSFVVFEFESLEDIKDDIHHFEEFIFNLFGCTENMCVILRKTSYSGQSVKLTGLLIAIDSAEFSKAQGQIAVRAGECTGYLAVVRAVHRFEQILFAFLRSVDGLEGIFAVLGVVAGSNVKLLVADMRGDYLKVAILLLDFAQILLEAVAEGGAFWEPKGEALAYLIAPPLESVAGLVEAMKAADVELAALFDPPSETNYGGGLLTGTQSACKAACEAFAETVKAIAARPREV